MPDQGSTTGTATSRAHQVRRAIRRQTRARLSLSGPSGSGKTWTALCIAQAIAPGKPIIVIDTEPGDGSQGAAELYADHFEFDTIQWDPPFDPRDLTNTIKELGRDYADGVCILDSASHFWRGEGGTLDVADGRFGGWKVATPAQDKMIDAILRSPMHFICCTRAKQTYEVELDAKGKQTVRKLGLAPIQRDDLEYEFQVVAMIDMEHRIDIGKTRAAPLAGMSFTANDQARFAEVYAEWLAGGAELPRKAELDALLAAIKTLAAGPQAALKMEMRDKFGPASSMTVEQMPEVWARVQAALGGVDAHPFMDEGEGSCRFCGLPALCGWHDQGAPVPTGDPVAAMAQQLSDRLTTADPEPGAALAALDEMADDVSRAHGGGPDPRSTGDDGPYPPDPDVGLVGGDTAPIDRVRPADPGPAPSGGEPAPEGTPGFVGGDIDWKVEGATMGLGSAAVLATIREVAAEMGLAEPPSARRAPTDPEFQEALFTRLANVGAAKKAREAAE